MQSRISLPPFVKVNFDVVISEEKVCIATIGKNHKWEVIFVLGKDIRRSRAINSWRLEAKAAYLATEKWKGSRIRYEAFNLWRKLSMPVCFNFLGLKSRVLTTQTVTFINASQTLSFFKKYFLTTFTKYLGPVWYMCLKTENCCLKIFVKIRVGEKVYWNTWNVV